jgi:hypothetical protein
MRACISCAVGLVAASVWLHVEPHPGVLHANRGSEQPASASVSPSTNTATPLSTLDRFLADTEQPLVSYRALRKLSVVARGGKMTASLTARTELDPAGGFRYEVLEEAGSGMLRSRVLHGVLEAERDARRRERGSHGALSAANYKFGVSEATADGLLRVPIHPLRKDSLLVEGSILLTNEDADLVRMEGLLVKRPSFWTRKVQIVRHYGRIAGIRVPVTISSIADILFAGQSNFVMDYEYEMINDLPVQNVASTRAR